MNEQAWQLDAVGAHIDPPALSGRGVDPQILAEAGAQVSPRFVHVLAVEDLLPSRRRRDAGVHHVIQAQI